jgi:4-amino-4-deoxy-L-arabinose transferase-like glycosyltransferase
MENEKIPRNILALIISVALLNLIISLVTQAFFAYGIFRDELYYLASTSRLDIGYVDHPPFSIWVLAIWKSLFGDSMFVIRIVPAIVSTVVIFIIGIFTLRLGGGKSAVIISTITIMLAPIFLGMNTIYSMNTFDFFFWISSSYIFLRIIQTGNKNLWYLLGIVLGLGLMNKTSMLWLCTGIFMGVIFTPLRKVLKTKYPYIAAIIALILFSPYIVWNVTHDFAHLEFMRNAVTFRYNGLSALSFVFDQIIIFTPPSILIWLPGLIFYFASKEGKQYRAVGFIWITTFLILLINGHSKGEYIAAAYQILYAGGAVMITSWSLKRMWLKHALVIPVIISSILGAPFGRPILAPETFLHYQSFMGPKPPSNEGHNTEFPQFYSDMFGWEEMAKNVSKVYLLLPEFERKRTVVYCSNYGKAGAIEYYSKKYPLPKVICPHNSYWFWWPKNESYASVIIIGGNIQDYLKSLKEVYKAGYHYSEFAMPYENNLTIFIGRGLKRELEEIKRNNKLFI